MPANTKTPATDSRRPAAAGADGRKQVPWSVLLAGTTLALATLAAYHNTFSAPFVLDDPYSITENLTIRHLWPPWVALSPPGGGATVSGRPVLNLSLAINYALSGTNVWSYHALNVLIHAFAGLTLFGMVRRTLQFRTDPAHTDTDTLAVALAVAGIWALHPLHTESVTYVIQRAESLMGWFYLLTLYGFIRATKSPHPARWHVLSIGACLLGMATKEVMVSAPVMVLLYDRTFVSGTFREAWRRHRPLYAGLASTWLLLGFLVATTGGNRGGSVGFGINIAWWDYTLTQFEAIVHYFRLSAWPHPLVFEYGTNWVHNAAEVVPYAVVVVLLVAGTLTALRSRPVIGFLGTWFFALLAPTSLVPGTTQMIVEHRMYLALAALVALGAGSLHRLLGRRSWLLFAAIAGGLGWVTEQRNEVYGSEVSLWSDTVAKSPNSAPAHNNLGTALFQVGRAAEAMREFERVLQISPHDPHSAAAHINVGTALFEAGRTAEAMQQFERTLQLNRGHAEAHYNMGTVFLRTGHAVEAIPRFEEAIRMKPDYPNAHNNLGIALNELGRTEEAIREYQVAIQQNPDHPTAHYNLANALLRVRRLPEAITHFEEELRIAPDDTKVYNNLGNALFEVGRAAEAATRYEQALRLSPRYAKAHNNLGTALVQLGRLQEAIAHHEEAVRLEPDSADLHYNLANALLRAGRVEEAGEHYQAALRIQPDHAATLEVLRRLQAGAAN